MAPLTFLDLCTLNKRRRKGGTKGHQKEARNPRLATKREKRKGTRGN